MRADMVREKLLYDNKQLSMCVKICIKTHIMSFLRPFLVHWMLNLPCMFAMQMKVDNL